jgi:hypothetical protein
METVEEAHYHLLGLEVERKRGRKGIGKYIYLSLLEEN